ncbi:hypothetical protein [Nocardia nepalensis]|uniref:hypothetical protein n=1 Tax=Nocardia nepalensis TaxID=3375448 RepID=UPI003B6728CA
MHNPSAALTLYLHLVGSHPATLAAGDHDELMARLIELGTTIQVAEDEVRREVDRLASHPASGRMPTWHVGVPDVLVSAGLLHADTVRTHTHITS